MLSKYGVVHAVPTHAGGGPTMHLALASASLCVCSLSEPQTTAATLGTILEV